ncbi:Inner-membrane translocator (plasmid) [Cupriavidus necator]|uniref:branched-chain amino acid ABC transporter permease n=1 Tax=Cupriavidus necator TaxID=106590 RepID=UPI003F73F5A9
MLELMELLLRGLLLGAIYGLLAYPVSLLFATTDSVDLGIGAYAVLAAAISMAIGGPAGIALGLAGAVLASLIVALLSQRINRRAHQDPLVVVLATFGFATMLESLVLTLFGKDPMVRQAFDVFWNWGSITVSPQALINLAVALVLLALLYVWLYRSAWGRDMRASASSALAATLAGIPVRRVTLLTYLAGGLLAGIAGVLILYTTGTIYSAGLHLTISGFGAALIFGLRSPLRGFAGGLIIGIVQGLSGGYLPAGWAGAVPLLFILLVLVSGRANVAGIAGGRA